MSRIARGLIVLLAALTAPALAYAQGADFYRGKQVTLIVGSDAGNGYDTYARLLARFLGKYIPGNPAIIVQNKGAAGGLVMMNDVANVQPKDGTVIGATQSGITFERLLHLLSPDGSVAQFDSTKLNWLGTMSQDVFILVARAGSPVKKVDDLKGRDFTYGASAPNTDGSIVVNLVNAMLGAKMKLITGYAGPAQQFLAMDRGEIDGASMSYVSGVNLRPDLLSGGKYTVLLQMGGSPHPALAAIPFFTSLVKDEKDRGVLSLLFSKYLMGRPYFLAEGVPADRVKILRTAFDAAMKDPELLADAKKQRLEINPLNGDEVQKLVARLYGEPDDLVRRTRRILGTEK